MLNGNEKQICGRCYALVAVVVILGLTIWGGYSQGPSLQRPPNAIKIQPQGSTENAIDQEQHPKHPADASGRSSPGEPPVNPTEQHNAANHEGDPRGDGAPNSDEPLWRNLEFWLGLFTCALVVVGVLQYFQLKRTVDSSEQSERAYMKMSHTGRGIVFLETGEPFLEIKIENFGRTPCKIMDAIVNFREWKKRSESDVLPAPIYAKESNHISTKGFLTTNDYLYLTLRREPGKEGKPFPRAAVDSGFSIFVAYGYVEYVDIFGKTHHGGWGRYYEPANDIKPEGMSDEAFAKWSNLSYIASDQYNYDRPAKQGSKA